MECALRDPEFRGFRGFEGSGFRALSLGFGVSGLGLLKTRF